MANPPGVEGPVTLVLLHGLLRTPAVMAKLARQGTPLDTVAKPAVTPVTRACHGRMHAPAWTRIPCTTVDAACLISAVLHRRKPA